MSDRRWIDLHRRDVLSIGGSLFALSLAGCTTGGSEGGSDESEDSDLEAVDGVDRAVELFYGEEARTDFGVTAIADGVRFVDIPDQGDDFPSEPDEGNQHALLGFEARNESDSPQLLPANWDLSLRHDGDRFDSKRPVGAEIDEYEGVEVRAGGTRSGELLYEVPDDLTEEDLTAIWADSGLDYELTVEWSRQSDG